MWKKTAGSHFKVIPRHSLQRLRKLTKILQFDQPYPGREKNRYFTSTSLQRYSEHLVIRYNWNEMGVSGFEPPYGIGRNHEKFVKIYSKENQTPDLKNTEQK
jgi:hypothetical protein